MYIIYVSLSICIYIYIYIYIHTYIHIYKFLNSIDSCDVKYTFKLEGSQ